jgi:hypothetical protein
MNWSWSKSRGADSIIIGADEIVYTSCLKKNAMEIQQAVVHHKRG